jgi:hypothetical protein
VITKSQFAEIAAADFFADAEVRPDHEHISISAAI